jgi:hypothetical protein
MNRLSEALRRADVDELEVVAEEIGRQAVQVALAAPVESIEMSHFPASSDAAKCDTEVQRQRDLDAALADAIEVISRARTRQGRRVCSRHDGEKVRQVFELLRSVMGPDGGADQDPSFQ